MRCKRQREWEEEAWSEFELREEEGETLPTEHTHVGEERVMCEEMEHGTNVLVTEMQGDGGMEGGDDGGGCVVENRGGQATVEPKRKPLRGKRRTKKSIREEGERRMANTLFQWMGTRPQ